MAGTLPCPHFPCLLDGPAEEEELLGDGGLAGIRMTDDGEGAPAVDFLLIMYLHVTAPIAHLQV